MARLGDGWMTTFKSPEDVQASLAMIRVYAPEMGRELKPDFEAAIYDNINIDEDRDRAFAEAKRFLDSYYSVNYRKTCSSYGWRPVRPRKAFKVYKDTLRPERRLSCSGLPDTTRNASSSACRRRYCRRLAELRVGGVQRAHDGRLSNGTPDWRPATRSDGSGVGAANRVKFRCQPTNVGRLSMTAAQAVPCPPVAALETA